MALALVVAMPAGASTGTWDRAWGKDVVENGSTAFEICTIAAQCKTGVSGSAGGELDGPGVVATDASGNVYVAERSSSGTNRIQKYDSSGNWQRAWGKNVIRSGGSGDTGTGFEICTVAADCTLGEPPDQGRGGELDAVLGMATDAAGNVYVSELQGDRIQVFNSNGAFQRAWGRDVVTGGGTGFEICTVAADCKSGVPGIRGGELRGASGIAVDSTGAVYVAEGALELSNRIQKFASNGTWQRAWGKNVIADGQPTNTGTGFEICTVAAECEDGEGIGGLGGELGNPAGLATDAANNVYVAEDQSMRIHKFDSSGNFQRTWGADVIKEGGAGDTAGDGFEICTVAADCQQGDQAGPNDPGGHLAFPDDVVVDGSGNVYVTEPSRRRLQKFNSSGSWQSMWGKDVIAIGGSGNTGTGYEVCTDASSCKIGEVGALAGEMTPGDVATDASANVYVADGGNRRIQKFDSNGTWQRLWGKDVIADPNNAFEICTVAANCKVGLTGGLAGELTTPEGVATDAAGNVYVAESLFGARVQKFNSAGIWQRMWGKDVIKPGGFGDGGTGYEICTVPADCQAATPVNTSSESTKGGYFRDAAGIGTDSLGNVYVADRLANRIQKFDSNGNFISAWGHDVHNDVPGGYQICTVAADCQGGAAGTSGGLMDDPAGLAVDSANSVYVSDTTNRRIQKFDSSGNWQRTWGKDVVTGGGTGFEICTVAADCKAGINGALGGEIDFPAHGLATGAGDSVYLADSQSERVQQFDSSGNFQRTWGKNVIKLGASGDAGSGYEICTVAADCQSGDFSTGPGGQISSPAGIATDSTGDVYVAANDRIQRFSSAGAWESAWGKNVIKTGAPGDTGGGFEICVVASDCQNGFFGALGGEFQGLMRGLATDAGNNLYSSEGAQHRVQKFDNDPPPVPGPSLSIGDVSQNEGNSGTTTYSFTVTLSVPAPPGGVTVSFATANGTATAGSDYTAKASPPAVTFAQGDTQKTVTVDVSGDTAVEPNETFFVNLSNATGASIGDAQGVGTIVNDDQSVQPPADSDGDGVPDSSDACPTVSGTTANGCPAEQPPPPDSDGDGVLDATDQCPTLAAATLTGCPVVVAPLPDPPPDATAGVPTAACFTVAPAIRKRTKAVPGGGEVLLTVSQTTDPTVPLKITTGARRGVKIKSVAFSVNKKAVASTTSSVSVPLAALKIGSRNAISAAVTLTNAKKVAVNDFVGLTKCPVPPVSCERLAGGAQLKCSSTMPLRARSVAVTVFGADGKKATGNAKVTAKKGAKKGSYTLTMKTPVTFLPGRFVYKQVVTTTRKGEKLLAVRVLVLG